jgi:hypothetical protein
MRHSPRHDRTDHGANSGNAEGPFQHWSPARGGAGNEVRTFDYLRASLNRLSELGRFHGCDKTVAFAAYAWRLG